MASFETREVTPADLFDGDKFYRVPNYHRPFSWDDDQFEDLINDTLAANRLENYFIGTVVFHETDDGLFDLVDGQQRFTALMVLFACLRDRLDDDDDKQELQDLIAQKAKKIKGIPERIRLQVKDRDIFNSVVVKTEGTLVLPPPDGLTDSQLRYLDACDVFVPKIEELSKPERSAYATFLTTKCQFIYLSAKTFREAFRLFEVVNDRGKQLRRIDVLKAKNISPDLIADKGTRDKVALDWERAEEDIGEVAFEEVFFLMRLALVKDKPKGDLLFEFEDRIFKEKLAPKGEEFVDLVIKFVELYRALFIDRSALDGTDAANKFSSLMFIMDSEFRASEWRACMLAFLRKFSKKGLYEFTLALETLYLTHSVAGVRKDERYKDYTKILRLIEDSSDPKKVIDEVPGDKAKITEALKSSNFYGRDFAKYALLRLELNVSDFSDAHTYSARSIEHVFPQTPKAGGAWDKQCSADERKQFVDSLGNLVLLSKSKNSSASNKEFEEKKSSYLDPRVSQYPQSMRVLKYADWDRVIVEARTAELADSFFQTL